MPVAEEVLAVDGDADPAAFEPELAPGLADADGSDGFGAVDGVAGADVAGAVPLGEVEQHDLP